MVEYNVIFFALKSIGARKLKNHHKTTEKTSYYETTSNNGADQLKTATISLNRDTQPYFLTARLMVLAKGTLASSASNELSKFHISCIADKHSLKNEHVSNFCEENS